MTPAVYRPQLAMPAKEAPDGDQWLHELKYDGYRIGCLIRREARKRIHGAEASRRAEHHDVRQPRCRAFDCGLRFNTEVPHTNRF
jgi:hypothetical protein